MRFLQTWVSSAAIMVTGCSSPATNYFVEPLYESADTQGATAWMRLELVSDCEAVESLTEQVEHGLADRIALENPIPGQHLVRARAYTDRCAFVAEGCVSIDIVAGASATLRLPMLESDGESDCSECEAGACDEGEGVEVCNPSEVVCDDGLDGDCDGLADCEDPDCAEQACDDGTNCTMGDVCVDFECKGEGLECEDDNPCTDNVCNDGECTFVPNAEPCDDGFWCNGDDQCSDGMCSVHSNAPCEEHCSEARMVCDECSDDSDCGQPSFGGWGECRFDNVCTLAGTQSREVKTPRCVEGTCTLETNHEQKQCARGDTGGVSCGSVRYGGWSGCKYANACSTKGEKTRDVFTPKCSGGACKEVRTVQKASCSRAVADGKSCGGTWNRCCGGRCTDLRSNNHCGGCNQNCSAHGQRCRSTGSGGYACTCSGDGMCRALQNNLATCYSGMCNCNCSATGKGVCADGGCGRGMWCHDCAGVNYCAPFGGSC